jgi:hypothetical protein
VSLFKYDLNEIFGGAVLIAYTDDLTVAVPDDISDVIAMVSPYALKTGWKTLGATSGPFQYGRNLTVGGWNVQQVTGTVLEEPTDVVRTFSAPAAEVRKEIVQMLEESPAIETVAAGVNTGAQKKIPGGTITELTQRRIAVIGRRKKAQGLVIEPGGAKRGRLAALIGYNTTIAADNAQVSMAEGDMASIPLQFTLHPDPTLTDEGEETLTWLFEDAGTISAT